MLCRAVLSSALLRSTARRLRHGARGRAGGCCHRWPGWQDLAPAAAAAERELARAALAGWVGWVGGWNFLAGLMSASVCPPRLLPAAWLLAALTAGVLQDCCQGCPAACPALPSLLRQARLAPDPPAQFRSVSSAHQCFLLLMLKTGKGAHSPVLLSSLCSEGFAPFAQACTSSCHLPLPPLPQATTPSGTASRRPPSL